MTAQLKAALVRALVIGVLTFGLTFFTGLAQDFDTGKAAINAAVSFFSVVLARGFGEGQYDTGRDRSNTVKPGDVGTGRG